MAVVFVFLAVRSVCLVIYQALSMERYIVKLVLYSRFAKLVYSYKGASWQAA